ncbi:hypothetical protein FACS189496_2200 [Bacilli bacterium]|nr:hypothetical protein FACS189496_2200 [Bacilli bacterium]
MPQSREDYLRDLIRRKESMGWKDSNKPTGSIEDQIKKQEAFLKYLDKRRPNNRSAFESVPTYEGGLSPTQRTVGRVVPAVLGAAAAAPFIGAGIGALGSGTGAAGAGAAGAAGTAGAATGGGGMFGGLLANLAGAAIPSIISNVVGHYQDKERNKQQDRDRQMLEQQMADQRAAAQAQMDEMRRQSSPEAVQQRADQDLENQKRAIEAGQYNTSGYTGDITWDKDANGRTVMRSTLSPAEQAKYDAQSGITQGLQDMSTSLDDNAKSYGDRVFGNFAQRAQPMFDRSRRNLDNDLWSRGISPLDSNYREAMSNLERTQGDVMNDAHLQAERAGMEQAGSGIDNRLKIFGALSPNSPINSFVSGVGGMATNPFGNANNYALGQQGMLGQLAANVNNSNTANAMNMYNMNNQARNAQAMHQGARLNSIPYMFQGLMGNGMFGQLANNGGVGSQIQQNQQNR